MRHLIDPLDFTQQEITTLLDLADRIHDDPAAYQDVATHKKLATLFYEPSTRTRLSFEAAMLNLGGHVLGFPSETVSSASKGESVADTIRVVSCYADIVAMRDQLDAYVQDMGPLLAICGSYQMLGREWLVDGEKVPGLGFNNADQVEAMKIVTQTALGFIAFTMGNEFRLRQLKETGAKAITIGILQAVIATIFVDVTLIVLHLLFPSLISISCAITLGAIASATAPAATLMVIRQYKADGPLTRLLMLPSMTRWVWCCSAFPSALPPHCLPVM